MAQQAVPHWMVHLMATNVGAHVNTDTVLKAAHVDKALELGA